MILLAIILFFAIFALNLGICIGGVVANGISSIFGAIIFLNILTVLVALIIALLILQKYRVTLAEIKNDEMQNQEGGDNFQL